jgi:membrane protease YdiL (CAAX protease family)
MIAQHTALQGGVAFAFLLAALIALTVILRSPLNYWRGRRGAAAQTDATKRFRGKQRRRRTASGTLISYAVLSMLLVTLHRAGAWNAASIGFTRHESLSLTAVAGVFLYYPLLYAYGIIAHLFKQGAAQQRADLHVTFRSLPRTRFERCVVISALCLINPVVEEIIFRGLLVHQFALLTGNVPRALVIGAIVNALNHAYQGWRAAPFQLLFYSAAVGLMYSSFGLAAAIALHYAADAAALLGLSERLQAYRKLRRGARPRADAVG